MVEPKVSDVSGRTYSRPGELGTGKAVEFLAKKTGPFFFCEIAVDDGTGSIDRGLDVVLLQIDLTTELSVEAEENLKNALEHENVNDAAGVMLDLEGELEKLAQLKEQGIITEEEFEAKKKQMLEEELLHLSSIYQIPLVEPRILKDITFSMLGGSLNAQYNCRTLSAAAFTCFQPDIGCLQ